jgi:hypothetical protein
MKLFNPTTENYVINFDIINKNKNLSLGEKAVIYIVISWQNNNKECTMSNTSIGNECGLSESAIKRYMVTLNKFEWFQSFETSHFNNFGKWVNSKKTTINEELFYEWLNSDKKREVKSKKDIIKTHQPIEIPEVINQPELKELLEEKMLEEIKEETIEEDKISLPKDIIEEYKSSTSFLAKQMLINKYPTLILEVEKETLHLQNEK